MNTKRKVRMGLLAIVVLLVINTTCSFATIEPLWTHFFNYKMTIYSNDNDTTESFYSTGNFTLNHTQTWKNGALSSTGTLEAQLYKVSGVEHIKVGEVKRFSGNGTFKPVYTVSSGNYLITFNNISSRSGEKVELSGSCMK